MIRQMFTLPRYGWTVYVFYDTGDIDAEEILAMLQIIGVSDTEYATALSNLS